MTPENIEPNEKHIQTLEELSAEAERTIISVIFANEIRANGEPLKGVLLTRLKGDGTPMEIPCIPISIDGGALELEASGYDLSVKISSIIKAEIIE